MTDLVYITPSLVASCTLLAAPTAASGYPATNVVSGSRGERFKRSAAATQSRFDFDATTNVQPTHIAIARADLIVKKDSASTQFKLIGSASNTFSSPETKTFTVASTDLIGPRLEDYATSFTYSTSYRYWRFEINTTASMVHEFSKVNFGIAYDLGHDPLYPRSISRDVAEAGNAEPAYRIRFSYAGILNATRYDFVNNIYRNRDTQNPFLYAPTYTKILHDKILIHARITDGTFQIENDYSSSMDLSFEELI